MAKLALYILRPATGREEQAPQLPDAKYSYLCKRRAKSAQGRNGINGGDPRSGEEAVYAGFGLEQTQRGARRAGLTNNAHQIIPRTIFFNQVNDQVQVRRHSTAGNDIALINNHLL